VQRAEDRRGGVRVRYRALIHRIEDNLDSLSAEDRRQISDAITVVRKARQTVTIGMPTVRPPAAAEN
jgi:hypothetical protein